MRHYSGWFVTVVLSISCSQQDAPPAAQAPAATAAPPMLVPTPAAPRRKLVYFPTVQGWGSKLSPTAQAAVDAAAKTKVSEIVLRIASPVEGRVELSINGHGVRITDIRRVFATYWSRRSTAARDPANRFKTLRFEVDPNISTELVTELHGMAQSMGAEGCRLVVSGLTAANDEHPINVRFNRDLYGAPFRPRPELVTFVAHDGDDGRLQGVGIERGEPFADDIEATVSAEVEHRVRAATIKDAAPPLFVVYSRRGLAADEWARLLFACQYRRGPDGRVTELIPFVHVVLVGSSFLQEQRMPLIPQTDLAPSTNLQPSTNHLSPSTSPSP